MDRRDLETHSLLRTYMTEREYSVINTEDMLTRQIKLMDKFRKTMEVASQRINRWQGLTQQMFKMKDLGSGE
jgi:hypothetical protein